MEHVASIPVGATILTAEEALEYFHQWTPSDRAIARTWIETTGVTDFYVPPSGGYVAGPAVRTGASTAIWQSTGSR